MGWPATRHCAERAIVGELKSVTQGNVMNQDRLFRIRCGSALLVAGLVFFGIPAASYARDPGLNQPGAAGNVHRDPGFNQPGAAGNVGAPGVGRDPGLNQPGAAGNVHRDRGLNQPGAAGNVGAPGVGRDPGINQPGAAGNRRR